MELEYELSREEYSAFVKETGQVARKRVKKSPLSLIYVVILLVGFALLANAGRFGLTIHLPSLFLGFAIAILMIFFGTLYLRKRLLKSLLPEPGGFVLGRRKLTIDDAGVSQAGTHYSSLIQWEQIMRVRETKDQILLYADNVAAVIVPKRAFSSDEDRADFLAKVWQHVPYRP